MLAHLKRIRPGFKYSNLKKKKYGEKDSNNQNEHICLFNFTFIFLARMRIEHRTVQQRKKGCCRRTGGRFKDGVHMIMISG